MSGIGVVSEGHLTAFGAIIHQYAKAESGIRLCLGGMVGMQIIETLILTDPYSAVNLRNVAKTIGKQWVAPKDHKEKFIWLIGQHKTFGPLRNAIGHSRWIEGQREGSIRPLGIDIRSGSFKAVGMAKTERDWTTEELFEEAKKLNELNQSIGSFMQASGLRAILKAKRNSLSIDI